MEHSEHSDTPFPPPSLRFLTHNEISEIRGICVSHVLHQDVSTQKKGVHLVEWDARRVIGINQILY